MWGMGNVLSRGHHITEARVMAPRIFKMKSLEMGTMVETETLRGTWSEVVRGREERNMSRKASI